MSIFRHSSYREQHFQVEVNSLRKKLADERLLTDLFLMAVTAEDESERESLIFNAIDAYVRSRSTPIVGT
jgi:hypothetical protein